MPGLPLGWILGGLAFIGIIAGAYFAVQHYNSVVEENTTLKIQTESLKAEKQQLQNDYQNIVSTVDKNAAVEQIVTEKTNTVIREIHSAPITTECVQSPSISIALKNLGDKAQ